MLIFTYSPRDEQKSLDSFKYQRDVKLWRGVSGRRETGE